MRFEVELAELPGTPDIVFRTDKIAVFLDGCFWHGCPLHRGSPQRLEYWQNNWSATQHRDDEAGRRLAEMGWTVLRFWQHDPVEDIAEELVRLRAFKNRTRIDLA